MLDIEKIQVIIISIVSGILAYFQPIEGTIYSLGLVFGVNFLAGLAADKIANGKGFSMKKAWSCVTYSAIFFAFCASVYMTGELNGKHDGAVQCVSTICYIVYYAFGCNIAKNLRLCFEEETPPYIVFDIIYSALSFEYASRMPWLGEYLKKHNMEGIETKNKNHGNNKERKPRRSSKETAGTPSDE